MMPDDSATTTQAVCFHQETGGAIAVLTDTQNAVLMAYRVSRSWRSLAEICGVSHNVLYALAHGNWAKVGWETVRLVRTRLSLSDPGSLLYAFACPSCGIVHGEGLDCHGQPIVAVIVLHPNERVTRKGKARTRKHYRRPCLSDDPSVCLDQLAIFASQVEAEFIAAHDITLPASASAVCTWVEDDLMCKWDTACGNAFCFITGTPTDNEMLFCPYCGRPLREIQVYETTET
jgi:hypothetical protein